jgi:serine/threonine protein kinase
MPDSTTEGLGEPLDLGQQLVKKGLVRTEAVDECLRLQRDLQKQGQDPVPRLGELLVERGYVSREQVLAALAEQDKEILWCPKCGIRVNVRRRPDVQAYKCGRCEGTLTAPPESSLAVADSSIIVVSREPLPPEVEQAGQDPARRFGKYVLVAEIGRGAIGVVHRAWDTYLNQYVALKRIKPPPGVPLEGDRWRETRVFSLLKEARNAIRLRHPNIVTIYDVGRVHREYYISMEYIEGRTMADIIRLAAERGAITPFYESPRRWIVLMRDLSRAVHYAHTRPSPIIHCDLKPSNVLVDSNEKGFILDFGLAKDLRSMHRDAAGTVSGTPSYMAPEQASGRTDEIDARSDVYGLGAILYELLTGRPPFSGNLADVLHNVVNQRPPRPSDVVPSPARENREPGSTTRRLMRIPPELEELCLRCLEKERDKRYQTAKLLAEELDRLLHHERSTRRHKVAGPAPSSGPPVDIARAVEDSAIFRQLQESTRKTTTRLTALTGVVLAFLVLLTIIVAVTLTRGTSLPPMTTDPQSPGHPTYAGPADAFASAAEDAPWMTRLRERVGQAADRARPKLEPLQLRTATLGAAEILKANSEKAVVFVDGHGADVLWAAFDPRQFVRIAEQGLAPLEPSDRFALGIYCRNAGLDAEARAFFAGLSGTPFESLAKRYQK